MRKVTVEIRQDADEEIRILCHELTPELLRLKKLAEGEGNQEEIEVTLGECFYFLRLDEVLFFEAGERLTAVHTKDRQYYTDKKLYEWNGALGGAFQRVSKSCVLNLMAVHSVRRDLTGIGEVMFAGSSKRVYVSRSYYKSFHDQLLEMRLVRGKDSL